MKYGKHKTYLIIYKIKFIYYFKLTDKKNIIFRFL